MRLLARLQAADWRLTIKGRNLCVHPMGATTGETQGETLGETLSKTMGETRGETIRNQAQSAKGQFSLGGTLGAGAGTAYRILRGKPGRNQRLLHGVQAGVSGFAMPLRNVLRVLFLEISGL